MASYCATDVWASLQRRGPLGRTAVGGERGAVNVRGEFSEVIFMYST